MNLLKRILIMASLVFLVACNEEHTWNQKLTVTVQTSNGVVQGSSVTTVIKAQNNAFWVPHEARGVRSNVRGEAVVVEVAPDKYLFVLLDGMNEIAQKTFPDLMQANRGFPNWAEAIVSHREVGIVPPEHYPTMVMFEDIADPMSAEEVNPGDLQSSFADGVRLTEISLEIVESANEAMTVKEFDFWEILREQVTISGLSSFDSTKPDPINYLTYQSFALE